jgi:hypothetical protein
LKVRNVFYQHVFLDVLTHLDIFRNSHNVSWHCPQHHPHQPSTPTGHAALKYISTARGCGNNKVRYYFQHHVWHIIANSPGIFRFCHISAAPCLLPPTHIKTTQPHATIIRLGNKLKVQRTKKVRNDILQMLSSFKAQVNSPHFLH